MGTYLAILVLAAAHAAHRSRADYLGIGLAAVVSWVGLPGPGEAALIAGGIAASRGQLDLTAVVATAWAGATVGGIAGWLIGRHGGRRIVLAGRWWRGHRERALVHGNRFFERYGLLAVYFAPSWVAGLNSMSPGRYLPANAISALVWALPIGVGAYVIGPRVEDIVSDIGLIGVAAIVAVAAAAFLLGRRRLHRADDPSP